MINSFSSYFELFAGLNLGYATIRGFRDAVNTELFGVVTKHKDLESKLGLITNKVILTFSESSKEYDKTTKFRKEFDDDRSLLEKELKNIIGLGIGFQILFRVVCIFCFSILIMGGFENYFDNKVSTLKILSISNLLFISFFAFFLIVRYYFKSFINYSAGIIVLIYFFIQCIPLILYIFQFSTL